METQTGKTRETKAPSISPLSSPSPSSSTPPSPLLLQRSPRGGGSGDRIQRAAQGREEGRGGAEGGGGWGLERDVAEVGDVRGGEGRGRRSPRPLRTLGEATAQPRQAIATVTSSPTPFVLSTLVLLFPPPYLLACQFASLHVYLSICLPVCLPPILPPPLPVQPPPFFLLVSPNPPPSHPSYLPA